MTIAESKQAENVIEYVLYMWNMEQLHRSLGFDIEGIQAYLGNALGDGAKEEELEFHRNLRKKMIAQGIEAKGHLYELNEIMVELFYLHNTLINLMKDHKYISAFEPCEAAIKDFRKRSSDTLNNDIEAMLTALFGYLSLKLGGKEVHPATQEAIDLFSKSLALLAVKYKDMKSGKMNFNLN